MMRSRSATGDRPNIKEQDDPLAWGQVSPKAFGTLYMWTQGHTAPMMQCERVPDMPAEEDQEVCVCGKTHGFPSMRNEDGSFNVAAWERWSRLQEDERWEPVSPITILDAMIREPGDPGP